jgi:hypothetical protein
MFNRTGSACFRGREYACVGAILAPTVTAWLLTIALDFPFLAEITCCCDTVKSTTLFGWLGVISDHVVDGVKREQSGAVGWLYMTSVVVEWLECNGHHHRRSHRRRDNNRSMRSDRMVVELSSRRSSDGTKLDFTLAADDGS